MRRFTVATSKVDFPNFNFFNFLVEVLITIVETKGSVLKARNDGFVVFKEIDPKLAHAKERPKIFIVVNSLGRSS